MSSKLKANPMKAAAVAYQTSLKHGVSIEAFSDVGEALDHLITELRNRQRMAKADIKALEALAEDLGLATPQFEDLDHDGRSTNGSAPTT